MKSIIKVIMIASIFPALLSSFGSAVKGNTGMPETKPSPTSSAEFLGGRYIESLDGQWQIVKVTSLDAAPPSVGWQPFSVPGMMEGTQGDCAWLRTTFAATQSWQGWKRVILHFGGVKYNSRILVNGVQVGGHFNGYDAFDVDVTTAVRWGEQNELLVGVHDWTGVYKDPSFRVSSSLPWDSQRDAATDQILSPIGGHYTQFGIWDSVSLQFVAPVYIDRLFVRPSVRQNRIEVDVSVKNSSSRTYSGTLKGRFFEGTDVGHEANGQWALQGAAVAELPAFNVQIAAGEQREFTLTLPDPPLSLWSPNDPRLYILEVGFGDQNGDAVRERIGYREFWVEGENFYLNGSKLHMLATSYWPPTQWVSRQTVRSELEAIKSMNAIAFRTHTQPWPDIWYETADEVGLLMIPEGAIWNDDNSYRVNDPAFWENYGEHLRRMVRALGNHPSVVMWSLENEFYGGRINDDTAYPENQLAEMGRLVRTEDPTRPITYESDGDPGGVTDVIGIHYPNEYPDHRLWPNDAYWLEEPRFVSGGGGLFWDNQPFLWNRRKPLYIGEYLWVPSSDPSTQTLFFGDEAYRDHAAYLLQGKALAWRMQIQAFRYYGVSGHTPWTAYEGGAMDESNPLWVAQRDLYRPLAVFLRDFPAHFYAGETIERVVDVFNDTLSDLPQVELQWKLVDGGQTIASGSEFLNMSSGERLERRIHLQMPQGNTRKVCQLLLALLVQGQEKFNETWNLDVFPRPTAIPAMRSALSVYDPRGSFSSRLKQMAFDFQTIDQLDAWDGQSLLIIGPGALQPEQSSSLIPVIGASTGSDSGLTGKVQTGGRILILEQENGASWLPVRLSDRVSTMAFPQMTSHPILEGFQSGDFRWWRDDNLVSQAEPERIAAGGTLPLVVSGGAQGISHTPLMEVRQGKGAWLICQLLVGRKLDSEPVARLLFERMLVYLDNYQQSGIVLHDDSRFFQKSGEQLGFDWQTLRNWGQIEYPAVQAVILGGQGAGIEQNLSGVKSYLEQGGQILWDQPDPDIFEQLSTALNIPVQIKPYQGISLKALGADGNGDLFDAFAREDLYWLGEVGPTFSETPLAQDLANSIFSLSEEAGAGQTYEAEKLVTLTGAAVLVMDGQINFYTNGTASWNVELPESPTGLYDFGISASGTPFQGGYPQVSVTVDGQPAGILAVTGRVTSYISLQFNSTPGKHHIQIAFSNDAAVGSDDRNLFVDRIHILAVRQASRMQVLASPATLVVVPLGQGRLVLNTIRWDEAGRNEMRAQRLFAGLMTALGVRLSKPAGAVLLEAEDMQPETGMPLYSSEGGTSFFAAGGYIEREVQVAAAGRYRIGLLGKGTPAQGGFPVVEIWLGSQKLGEVEIASDAYKWFYITVDLRQGVQRLRLRFSNDLYLPEKGEDRNLWLDRISFAPE